MVEGDLRRKAQHLQSFFFFSVIIGWSNRQLGGLHTPRPFGSVCPSQQTICEDFQADESDPCGCSQELNPNHRGEAAAFTVCVRRLLKEGEKVS